jgi:hypothetical protein
VTTLPDPEKYAALEAIARELLRADEKSKDRKVGRVLLALCAALRNPAPRLDVLEGLDKVARKHLQAGIDGGEALIELLVQGGGVRSIRRVIRVGPVGDQEFELGLVRLVARYKAKPFSPERAQSLAGEFAVRIEERWPSLPYDKTVGPMERSLVKNGIAKDPEQVVVRTARDGGVTAKHWRNPFNAEAVAAHRKSKV